MPRLRLFEGFGVEIEYMLVDARTLDVAPLCDKVIWSIARRYASEIEVGDLAWSNELALHVIELKTNGPARRLEGLPAQFQEDVGVVNRIAAAHGAQLMPGAMHPWMDPERELVLWPHESSPIYETFHRIFGCHGHGWSNLQSTHLNLPFGDDEEFGKLHAAIRLVLPLLPALSASSPFLDGKASGLLDTRMHVYRSNAAKVPSVTGQVIPEPVFTAADYAALLQGIYRDLAPHDPEKIIQHEWVNARGAIARFDRRAIEIRVLDTQECPKADLAICAAAAAVVRAHVEERWIPGAEQRAVETASLARVLERCVEQGERATVDEPDVLAAFGRSSACSVGELWAGLVEDVVPEGWRKTLGHILRYGPLARRLLEAAGPDPSRERLATVYGRLCHCLRENTLFP